MGKGETIYRQRPYYYVLERMTHWRLRQDLIENNVIQRMIETRTPLAATLRRMPVPVREFIHANYVPIAFRLWVLGQSLGAVSRHPRPPVGFDIAVPARYALVTPDGPADGLLDGVTLDGPRDLAAGHHEYLHGSATRGHVILVWAKAVESGYSPFRAIKPDAWTSED